MYVDIICIRFINGKHKTSDKKKNIIFKQNITIVKLLCFAALWTQKEMLGEGGGAGIPIGRDGMHVSVN